MEKLSSYVKNPAYKNINTSAPQKKESTPPAEDTLSFFKRWFY